MTYTKNNITFQPLPNTFGENITRQTFGRLTVIGFAFRKDDGKGNGGRWIWWCECDCGNVIQNHKTQLRRGKTKSCGCLRREVMADKQRTHGLRDHSLYNTWRHMHQRCNNPKNKEYKFYGARGIEICDRWGNFANFLVDMGEKPSPKHSIERKDNNGNYTPENCKWALPVEQQNNKRNNRTLTLRGKTQTVTQWSRELNCSAKTLFTRAYQGWTDEAILTTPILNFIT